ncbi:type I-E CRISPR-associated protein Cas5/CasD [Spiractinospora alimapuensis]|uniref:type I-E CRISPR-associated protein Cas5/CasD n=1 Tax=Spiractinospora alimapuensis TaxID=2820884 RepID=UPI001EEAD802|nr:type I-E CRISPR-associated protein Cas5/CasD [Spiractinospora alimapuensis]QVQ51589.1 type I-E CRISPR-associated protein Cas5/CasD [Spiractinospora alimapuensis]
MAEATLALRIDAPMQSWGVRSRFIRRDTESEPTKSGIVGLLAAAMGIPRDDPTRLPELTGLRMAVRVDREGLLEFDFHTTQDVPNTFGKAHRTVVSHRFYLADALFLVLLHGERAKLRELMAAIERPHWPLYFGRKAFVPGRPLIERNHAVGGERQFTGLFDDTLESVLHRHPWLERDEHMRAQREKTAAPLRAVVETDLGDAYAELRNDVPTSFAHGAREFTSRAVRTEHVDLAALEGWTRVP